LEERAEEKRGKCVAYCWVEAGEDEDVALAKWKQENGGENPDLEIFIVRWASCETWPLQGSRVDRPEWELKEILESCKELLRDGASRTEIEAIITEERGRDYARSILAML
jgi:hypothetical protein